MAKPSKPDTELNQAVQAVADMLAQGVPHPDQGSIMCGLQACCEDPKVSRSALDDAVRRLAALAEPLDLEAATFPVFGCGLAIENGGDPAPAVAVTLRFARESVRHAAALVRAAVAARRGKEAGFVWEELALFLSGGTLSPLQVVDHAEAPPEVRAAARTYIFLSPALYNVLVRSEAARRQVLADPDFLEDLRVFRQTGDCPEALVPRLLEEALQRAGPADLPE